MENHFAEVYDRDLIKLRDEVKKFKDEANIWHTVDGISNSAGTLVLHLLGNLNLTIGAQLGGIDYVRNREVEFSLTGIPQAKIIADIENVIELVKTSFNGIDQEKLDKQYPLEMFGQKSTTYYLTFFYGHFAYHLGQINYLRRMLEPA